MCGESHFADLEKRHESMVKMFYRVVGNLFDLIFLHDSGHQMPQKKTQGRKVKYSQNRNSGLETDTLDARSPSPVLDPGQQHEDMKFFTRLDDLPQTTHQTKILLPRKERIWNISWQEERERIKEFWISLGGEERRAPVKVEKKAILKKMKEHQKKACSCLVCLRKRTATEEELEVLYDACYEELEQYAKNVGWPTPMMPRKKGIGQSFRGAIGYFIFYVETWALYCQIRYP